MKVVLSARRSFGVCVAFLMLSACTGAPIQPGPPAAVPQSLAPPDSAPMMTACPTVGKTYARGDAKGKVSVKFQQAYTKAGEPYERLRTQLVYSNWPQNRPTIYRKDTITTCGRESGKAPVGEVETGGGSLHEQCHNGTCTITLNLEVKYKPPATLPGGRQWKFDLLRFAPDKPMKGFEPLPFYKVVINR